MSVKILAVCAVSPVRIKSNLLNALIFFVIQFITHILLVRYFPNSNKFSFIIFNCKSQIENLKGNNSETIKFLNISKENI